MDLVYKNMQPYSHQNDQMHYRPHFYPGAETFPSQMYVNPARPPVNYGCWPLGGNYGYPTSIGCHSCCNHTYMPPHYAWGSPYSHVPALHCPGSNYPSFPGQYVAPPPCYGPEQPRYEYEKKVSGDHHCCGCPNHTHHREHKNLRIEEEEPEKERRMVPSQFKNSPYPIVWLPPDYSKSNEKGRVNESEDQKDGSRENGRSVEQKPSSWNGWYPLDLNSLVSPKQRGDGERNHLQDDGKGRFPFPLFWLPYDPEEKESEKHMANNALLESQKGSDTEQNAHVTEEDIGGNAASRAKDIPVKDSKQHEEKESSENRKKGTDASAKASADSGEKKPPKDGDKRKASSPPKSSKLPPVCLRVDPLPRRKNANGSSRSPSPLGDRQEPGESKKVLNSSDSKKPETIKESKGTKTIEVVDGNTQQQKDMVVNVEAPVKVPAKSQEAAALANQKEEKTKEDNVYQRHTKTDASIKSPSEEDVIADETKKPRKTELSGEQAAVIIQSAYRGFDTRRWEPIKKLKQIAKVKEEMSAVKNQIQELESATDIQLSGKQRNIIAETIMSLLLKLDTIQGLHSSVREVRKSLVRELVSLQEKLDSAMNAKSENLPEQGSAVKRDEDGLNENRDVISNGSGNEMPSDLLEAHQNQLGGGSDTGNSEISETNLVGDEMSHITDKLENEAAEICATKGFQPVSEPTTKTEDDKTNEVLVNDKTSIAKEEDEGQRPEPSPLQDNSSVKVINSEQTDCDKLGSDLAELPQGVTSDLYAQEITIQSAADEERGEVCPAKQFEEEAIEDKEHGGTTDEENKEDMKIHEVRDVPLNEDYVKLEAEETSPIHEYPVCDKIGDAGTELDECVAQQQQDSIADISEAEPSEVSDDRELPIAESNSSAPSLEEAPELLQNGELEQEKCLLNEKSNTNEEEDTAGVKEAAKDKSNDDILCFTQERGSVVADIRDCEGVPGEVREACQVENGVSLDAVPEMEAKSEQDEECHMVQSLAEENNEMVDVNEDDPDEAKDGSVSQVDPTPNQDSSPGDDLKESNRKLMEENERLRDTMEKLIKSGQEQLTAISSLTGRVKDLEKRLSKKKKLKMKKNRAPKLVSDGYMPM